MTLAEATKRAVATEDGKLFSGVVEALRGRGLNYQQVFEKVSELTGIDLDTFEGLCQLADEADTQE